jgi:phosphonoacetate hydrolase
MALGSFAQVHLAGNVNAVAVQEWLLACRGITEVHTRAVGARLMELPADRMGDLVVASGRDVVLGRTPAWHDLKAVQNGLRSHGGRYEEIVPFFLSEALNPVYTTRADGDLRNFDIFEFTCNGAH